LFFVYRGNPSRPHPPIISMGVDGFLFPPLAFLLHFSVTPCGKLSSPLFLADKLLMQGPSPLAPFSFGRVPALRPQFFFQRSAQAKELLGGGGQGRPSYFLSPKKFSFSVAGSRRLLSSPLIFFLFFLLGLAWRPFSFFFLNGQLASFLPFPPFFFLGKIRFFPLFLFLASPSFRTGRPFFL